MTRGKVIFFNRKKGWGLVESDKGEVYFAHYTSIKSNKRYKTMTEGQKVLFEPREPGMKVVPGVITIRQFGVAQEINAL